MLHAVNTQHGLQRIGPSAIARLGIKRLDDSGHILPWQNLLHAGEENLFSGLTALSAEFTIGEGELMAHDVPLGCAPDEYDDLISGTCSHLPYDKINKDDIDINDIAVSLSNICRFAGHLSHFYSVAQHAVLCSQLVPQEFAFEALMHDATEAYCQDIPAPLKRLLPDYKRMEEKIDAVIREKYGLPPVMSTPVKYADLIMLATERRDLGLDDGSFWPVLEGIPATEMFNVIPLAPGHAYGMFMERFNDLSELRKCA